MLMKNLEDLKLNIFLDSLESKNELLLFILTLLNHYSENIRFNDSFQFSSLAGMDFTNINNNNKFSKNDDFELKDNNAASSIRPFLEMLYFVNLKDKGWSPDDDEDADCLNAEQLIYVMLQFVIAECLDADNSSSLQNRRVVLSLCIQHFRDFGFSVRNLFRFSEEFRNNKLFIFANNQFSQVVQSLEREEKEDEEEKNENSKIDLKNKKFKTLNCSSDPAQRRASVIERDRLTATALQNVNEFDWSAYGGMSDIGERIEMTDSKTFLKNVLILFFLEVPKRIETVFSEIQMLIVAEKVRQDPNCMPKQPTMRLDGEGKGTSRNFAVTINNMAELRNYFSRRVFQPGHALPTVSLDECAEYEFQTQARNPPRKRRTDSDGISIHSSEEEEDDDERIKKKEAKERQWDDWLEENPRGSGNKNINVG